MKRIITKVSIGLLIVFGLAVLTGVNVAYADPVGKPCTLPSGKAGTTSGNGNCTATDGSGETGPAGNNASGGQDVNSLVAVPSPVAESSVGTVTDLVQRVITFLGWVIGVVSVSVY